MASRGAVAALLLLLAAAVTAAPIKYGANPLEATADEKFCVLPAKPTNGWVKYDNESGAIFGCDAGFKAAGASRIECDYATGAWKAPSTFACTKVECVIPRAPSKGVVVYNGRGEGASATFRCNKGYVLRFGDGTRTCGSDGKWAPARWPQCVPKHGATFGVGAVIMYDTDNNAFLPEYVWYNKPGSHHTVPTMAIDVRAIPKRVSFVAITRPLGIAKRVQWFVKNRHKGTRDLIHVSSKKPFSASGHVDNSTLFPFVFNPSEHAHDELSNEAELQLRALSKKGVKSSRFRFRFTVVPDGQGLSRPDRVPEQWDSAVGVRVNLNDRESVRRGLKLVFELNSQVRLRFFKGEKCLKRNRRGKQVIFGVNRCTATDFGVFKAACSADGSVALTEYADKLCEIPSVNVTSRRTCDTVGAQLVSGFCRPLFVAGLKTEITNYNGTAPAIESVNTPWGRLSRAQRKAAKSLNFTKASWNKKTHRDCSSAYALPFRPEWTTLSPAERAAAEFLGFNALTWDEPCVVPEPTEIPISTEAPALPIATAAPGPRRISPIIDPGCGLPICASQVHCCQPSLQRCGHLPPCHVLTNPAFIAPTFRNIGSEDVFQSFVPVAVETCKGCK